MSPLFEMMLIVSLWCGQPSSYRLTEEQVMNCRRQALLCLLDSKTKGNYPKCLPGSW